MKKNVIIVGVFLLCMLVSVPSVLGSFNSTGDYNLKIYIKPSRYAFPRIYYGNGQPIGFVAGAINEGPERSPAFTLKFEIIKILSKESYHYNITYDFPSQPKGQGMGTVFTWYTLIAWHFGIYEARATIDINDNNTQDNMKSYYFIIIGH
jgi:hypothetical protein